MMTTATPSPSGKPGELQDRGARSGRPTRHAGLVTMILYTAEGVDHAVRPEHPIAGAAHVAGR